MNNDLIIRGIIENYRLPEDDSEVEDFFLNPIDYELSVRRAELRLRINGKNKKRKKLDGQGP
jgi:hypothetical protein